LAPDCLVSVPLEARLPHRLRAPVWRL